MIRRLLAWLSARFPEQRVVKLEEYNALNEGLVYLSKQIAEMNVRLVQTEAQMKRLNDQAGYVSSSKGSFKLER